MPTMTIPDDFPVDMLVLPSTASALMGTAEAANWAVAIQFVNVESAGGPYFTMKVGHPGTKRRYDVTWHSRATGGKSYRLFGKIMQEGVGRHWVDAPSVTSIRQFIAGHPA